MSPCGEPVTCCFESTFLMIHQDQRSWLSGKAPNRLKGCAHLQGADFSASGRSYSGHQDSMSWQHHLPERLLLTRKPFQKLSLC